MASWLKPVLISTGCLAVAMHIKAIVPVAAVDFSRVAPILLSSFLSWLKPPYLYVIINVIIVIIGVSSRYFKNVSTIQEEKDNEGSYREYKNHNHQSERQFVHQDPPKDSDFSFLATISPAKIVVVEKSVTPEKVFLVTPEKDFLVTPEKVEEKKSCLVVVAKPGNMAIVEKPLVSARIGNRKLVKTTITERNVLKALKVAKERKHETLENTWKLITEGKPKPLTGYYRRPDTLGIAEDKQSGLKKAETLKDRAKFYLSPAVSRSRDELNRRAEAFIKKCNNERFESMRLDREVTRRGLSF